MAQLGHSLMDILQPPGNHWLESLGESDEPLPEGVRVVRNEDGELEVFESGTPAHRIGHHEKPEPPPGGRSRHS
ncbi:MAG TPA: hypothetical protein VF816_00225 [Rhodocyclaceae bacterium]